ncbi:MAG: ATP-grasp domain-containing protein [Lachnospiraceae bacterium]
MHIRLLILGSLGEFVPLIRQAKERGLYTVVCDGYPNGIGKQYADAAYTIDVGDTAAMAALCQEERITHILTSYSDYLFESMIRIAEAAGLPAYYAKERLPYYRNKQIMKDMLLSLNIATPKFCTLSKDFSSTALAGFTYPLVAKPLDKYGSRGVMVLNSLAELRANFDHICETSQTKAVLVDEYHTGYEFNMMTWVHQGTVHVLSIADREKSPIGAHEIPISSRNVYPSLYAATLYEPARSILQKVAEFTGQTEGALSMQFFWRPGEPISVCEVAGRFFGYEHELLSYVSELSTDTLLLDSVSDPAALSRSLLHHSPFFTTVSAVLYFHGKPGKTVQSMEALYDVATLEGVRDSWIFYKEGETIVKHGPNPYVARFYIAGETRAAVDALTRKIVSMASVRATDGEEVLYPTSVTKYIL